MLFNYLGWTQSVFGPDGGRGDMIIAVLIAIACVVLGFVCLSDVNGRFNKSKITTYDAKKETKEILQFMGIALLPLLIATWPFAGVAILALGGYLFLNILKVIGFSYKMVFGTTESSGSSNSSSSNTSKSSSR